MRIRKLIESEELAASIAAMRAEVEATNLFYGTVRLLNKTRAGKNRYTEEYVNLLHSLREQYPSCVVERHWNDWYKQGYSPHKPDWGGQFRNDAIDILGNSIWGEDLDWEDIKNYPVPRRTEAVEVEADTEYSIIITEYEEEADVLTTPINLVLA